MTSRSSAITGRAAGATLSLELALQRSEYRRLGLLLLSLATLACLGLLRLLTDRTLSDTDAQATRSTPRFKEPRIPVLPAGSPQRIGGAGR